MFKAWVCIIIMASGYQAGGSVSMIGDIARQSDCERLGRIAVQSSGESLSYKCVQIVHTPE
jgi:hypothetical protein